MVEFARFTLKLFHDVVLTNSEYVDLILNGPYRHETYSMGLVDEQEPGQLLRRPGARGRPGGEGAVQVRPAGLREASWRSGWSRGPT